MNLVSENGWRTRSTITAFADEHLTVVTELVQTPAQVEPKTWTTVRRKPAVVIAPMTVDGKFVLGRQERIPIREFIWEMPAGQIDESEPNDKQIAATAVRELREETGYAPTANAEITSLGHFFSSPGLTDERAYFFLAHPVELNESTREKENAITDCRAFTTAELRDMIAANEIRDANTLSICARMAARGLLSLHPEK